MLSHDWSSSSSSLSSSQILIHYIVRTLGPRPAVDHEDRIRLKCSMYTALDLAEGVFVSPVLWSHTLITKTAIVGIPDEDAFL